MSMAGYTKLFNSILMSTIWREDDKTRILWITLLAMADKNGIAETSLPSLADAARVSFEDCKAALEKLKSPDEYSRTKEHDGRRIQECDGGFFLLNHGKYRAKMSADERREYNRLKQAEWRNKNVKHQSATVIDKSKVSTLSAHTEAEADTKAEAGERDHSFSEIPSWNEFWEYCQSPQCGIAAEWFAKDKYLSVDDWSKKRDWRKFALRVRGWWDNDGRPMNPPHKNGKEVSPNVAAIQNQTALERVEERQKTLRGRFPLSSEKEKTEWNDLKTERSRLMNALNLKA
jgi:hypothetical protein